jgi:hypothetical protein
VAAYGLPEVDLRAVVLDAWDGKRNAVDGGVPGYPVPRDPGVIPVVQLNAIFGRDVPFGMCPFTRMRSLDDTMEYMPRIQQSGVELLLRVLEESDKPVHLMSFGSARPLAVAYNRRPDLFESKLARIYLSAGTNTPTYMEWNVYLDPLAIIRIAGSGLPISFYPCATVDDCYSYDNHNTFWSLPDLRWIGDLHPHLRRYLGYALGRSARPDYLRALDEEAPADVMEEIYSRHHSVWETAAWMDVAGRKLVRRPDGTHRIILAAEVRGDDAVIRNDQVPCSVTTHENGLYSFDLTDEPSPTTMFVRDDPAEYKKAMIDALPALYQSFQPTASMAETGTS